jgi:hypothetical protein
MTIPFKKLKAEWMKDPAFRAEYDKLKPKVESARARRSPSSPASKAATPRRT